MTPLISAGFFLLQAFPIRSYTPHASPGLYIFTGIVIAFVLYRLTKSDPARQLDAIHAHQSHHFEDFRMSAQDFYADLSAIITDRQFPDVEAAVVVMNTGSFFDARRAYLKVASNDHVFYVCAAPFGKNFFVSYWLRDTPENAMEFFWRKVFGYAPRKTFFQIDTEVMFMESIKKAVLRAIEHATEHRGMRRLAPDELIPTILP